MRKLEEVKRIGTEFYTIYGIQKDAEKLKKYMGDYYKQHNPHVQDGVDNFLDYVKFRRKNFPEGKNMIKLTIVDGDKVMFHVHSVLVPGTPGRNLVDTFRIKDGRIWEHWDVISHIPDMLFPPIYEGGLFNEYGDSILGDLDKTEENRKIVTEFYLAATTEHDVEKTKKFLGEEFLQHSLELPDGVDNFLRFVKYRKENFPNARNDIKLTVAQGNLVGFHVHSVMIPGELGRNLVDIFRVENGKIVEHWGTSEEIRLLRFPPINGNGLY